MNNIVSLSGGKDSTAWRSGKDCDLEKYTEYFCKSRGKVRHKWTKYNYVECSVCGKKKLKLKTTQEKHLRNYCSEKCRAGAIKKFYNGKNHMSYQNGRFVHYGYILIKKPEHHRSDNRGYVKEHILVAEKMLDRPILPNEHVHHINESRGDNRPENLQVLSVSAHRRLHANKNKIWKQSPMWKHGNKRRKNA